MIVESMLRSLAVARRYVGLLFHSWPRVLEIVYMPTITIFQWVIIRKYFESLGVARLGFAMLSSWMLWEIVFRCKQGTVMSLYNEMWSRSLGHFFSSPLQPLEFLFGCFAFGLVRASVALVLGYFLIELMGRSSQTLVDTSFLGLALIGLVISGAVSLLMASFVLLRGISGEMLSWAVVLSLIPLSGVFYPITMLPEALQLLALAVPTTYLFDCVREFVATNAISDGALLRALSAAGLWLALGTITFLLAFEAARRSGSLMVGADE